MYEGSYFSRNEEVVLYANANLPNGSTLEQMNTLVKRVETYLSGFKEIKQFHTSVYNARRGNIQIYFKKEYQHSGFPYTLKANLIGKVSELGAVAGMYMACKIRDSVMTFVKAQVLIVSRCTVTIMMNSTHGPIS